MKAQTLIGTQQHLKNAIASLDHASALIRLGQPVNATILSQVAIVQGLAQQVAWLARQTPPR